MKNYEIVVNMPTTSGRKKSRDFIPGTPFLHFNKNEAFKVFVKNKIGTKQKVLSCIFSFEETDTELILKKGSLFIIPKENDMLEFEEEFRKQLTFNKKSKKGLNDLEFDGFINNCNIDNVSEKEVLTYISRCIDFNENVKEFFYKNIELKNNWGRIEKYKATIYAVTYSLNELERLYNAGQEKIIKNSLIEPDFKFSKNTKKMSHTVGLPPFALAYVNKLKIESTIPSLNILAEGLDGNSIKILLEFMDNSSNFLVIKNFKTKERRNFLIENFFINLKVVLDEKYKIKDVLNYVLKQRMFWNSKLDFGFPFEEMATLKDYINMNKNAGLKYIRYPQYLQRMHDVCILNTVEYDLETQKEFIDVVSKYKKYENELKKDGYSFITPKNIKDLVNEGNELNHCIGSYVHNIISGKSKIFFMRETANINKPFVTIEIDDSLNIVEIKEKFDIEPKKEIVDIARKWAGICKRL